MNKTSRRSFLKKGTLAASGAIVLSQIPELLLAHSKNLNIQVGFQTFPIRDILAKDFAGTLKMMAGYGFQLTEMCSPIGYKDIGYGPLIGIKPTEMRKIINDSGLQCPSCHFGSNELFEHIDESIEFSHALGLNQMICSSFELPKNLTLSNYKEASEKLNKAGEKIKKAGMQAGFHNHELEFTMLEGQLIYDVLMNSLDPKLVKMQFQTEVINLGYKGSTYFKKYPGRFISSHLSDWTADKKEVPIGKGVIDWKEFFEAAKMGGVRNFFVEMDLNNMKESAPYIHSL